MYRTLKVVKYRGSHLYIRHLEGRRYEVLVCFRGRIYAHQIYIQKTGRLDKRLSVNEVEESAIDQCLRAGIQLCDNLHKELTWRKVGKQKLINLKNNLWQNLKKKWENLKETTRKWRGITAD